MHYLNAQSVDGERPSIMETPVTAGNAKVGTYAALARVPPVLEHNPGTGGM